MEDTELISVIEWLQVNEGLILPHGEIPGTHNQVRHGNVMPGQNEDSWIAYQWNPPQYHEQHIEIDVKASLKPTWQDLMKAIEKVKLQNKIDEAKYMLIYGNQQGRTTDDYKREIIVDTGVKAEIVEAAHINIIDDYKKRLAKVTDTNKTIKERIALADSLVRYVNAYRVHLETWIYVLTKKSD